MSSVGEADARCARRNALSDELGAVQTALRNTPDPYQQLLLQRDNLMELMAPFRVAPHEKLPAELLVEIFNRCVDTAPPTVLPLAADHPWWSLLHTCSAWRATVLESMPELWGSISFTFSSEHSLASFAKTCDIYATWLRSADSTATLCLQATCARNFSSFVALTPIAETFILPHASRFRKLDLTLPTESFLPLFSAPPSTFPQLEDASLRAVIAWADLAGDWPGDISAFCDCPKLRSIGFYGDLPPMDDMITTFGTELVEESFTDLTNRAGEETVTISEAPSASLLLPWRTLRALSMSKSPRPVDFWYDVLAQCRQLQSLDISVYDSPSEPTSKPLIELDCLTELQLGANGTAGITMLSWLRVPALKLLIVRGQCPIPSVLALHSRSDNPALETFTISCPISTSDAFIVFSTFPSLTTFGIFLASTEHFPDTLWLGLTTGKLLPKLTTLLISPRRTQTPVLIAAMSQSWDTGRPEMLEVMLHVLIPEEKEAMEKDLEPLERFNKFGKTVSWMSY